MKIASFLRGIDFVFEVKELNNRDHMIKQLKEQYIKRKEEETTEKTRHITNSSNYFKCIINSINICTVRSNWNCFK